ncbi:DUF2141 domain-containing protein [Paraburkholderia sp. J69-2]|uniref:DUF2141 domain-containing protein n=1 Tax=Paraburkholderia sp. J69-2 TaxID=2805437 RepID=UPI002AB2F567|nr:DUF2141 domain-containing protein [Paraburkholderia sp. J69-2]
MEVRGIGSTEGKILVALYNKPADFPGKTYFRAQAYAAQPSGVEVVFKDLPPGDYALAAFQDKNGNEKLDTNGIGIPIEPFGFSNDAQGVNGPPRFDDAKFRFGGVTAKQTIELR